jgi:hypothetical protein
MRNCKLTLVALMFALFVPITARACLCNISTTQSQYYKNAFAVFSGKVKEVETVENKRGEFIGHRVKVFVEKSWKFVQEREITLFNSGLCGYSLEAGEKYLFYVLLSNDKEFRVEGKCSTDTAIFPYSRKYLEDLEWREELELPKDTKSPKRDDWLFPKRNLTTHSTGLD